MISPDLQALLEPLQRFESIRRRAARLGGRLADLAYANPYGGVQEQAKAVLRETLDTERTLDLQYSPFGGKTQIRRIVADSLRGSHDLPFAFNDVVLTPGAMAALQLALRVAGRPGDGRHPTGEVQAHLAEVYGAQVSRQTISTITDKVIEGMNEWQNRPLDPT